MEELFLVPFAGTQYGIRKNDIQSVRSLDALHRIPLCPAPIAGIMVDGGHTVTLANLPVCMGSASTQDIEHGCILLMEKSDRLTGFVVGGELRTQSISPELLFPLPDCLQTQVFDGCAVHDNVPIPLIKLAELYWRALEQGVDTSVESFRVAVARHLDISEMERIRFFSVGGERFAASASGMEDIAVRPGPITPLPNTPPYVKGITFFKGRLLPVVDLSQRVKWQNSSPGSVMLKAGIGDSTFGLLIDCDGDTIPSENVAIEPVPFIVQTAWLKHVVVRTGELIPLIDFAMAISEGSVDDEVPIWQRYAPDSVFPQSFLKCEVEVVEFSLLGERYALPKDEVEDVIPFKPCRALPTAPPIVIGVAEHNEEILPVVDLAMMFGRRSLTTPEWRMMLVKNGNFRALVVTETVYGGRQLPPEIHRTVPINLPHNLMYGCYPDGKAARIILNVEAISVHFEKSLIKKLLPTLSHEMRTSPTGEAYVFPGEKAFGTPHALATPPVSHATRGAGTAVDKQLSPRGPDGTITPTSDHATRHDAPAEMLSTKTIARERHRAEAESSQPIVALQDTSNQPQFGDISTAPEFATMEAQPADMATIVPATDASAVLTQMGEAANAETTGALHRDNREVEQVPMPHSDEAQTSRRQRREIAFDMTAAVLIAALIHFSGPSDRHAPKKLMRPSEAAKTAQPTRLPEQASAGSARTRTEPATEAKAVQAGTQAEREEPLSRQRVVRANSERDAKHQQSLAPAQPAKAQPTLPMDTARAPLELVITKNMPKVDIDEYVVVQGDTLWSISERFTGNPFNYPRVAGENRIANPELIFPGQRIRLIQK